LIFAKAGGVVMRFHKEGWLMRKFLIVAGLALGGALFAGTPAKAELGCMCVKFGAPGACTPGIASCTAMGGICLAPCDYTAPKVVKHMRKHKKHKRSKKK
jgi:hypothetical protein